MKIQAKSKVAVAALAVLMGAAVPTFVPSYSGARAVSVASENQILELKSYRDENVKGTFHSALESLSADRKAQALRVIHGIYYIDYRHTAKDLLSTLLEDKRLEDMTFPTRYDSENNPSFQNFVRAREITASHQGPVSTSLVRQLHAVGVKVDLHAGRIFNPPQAPGTFRRSHRYGPEIEKGLTQDVINVINENPYLYFLPATRITMDTPIGASRAQVGDRTKGVIVYPRPRDIKHETLVQRIRPWNPNLYQRVMAYQAEHGGSWTDVDPTLTRALVDALVAERLANFEREAAKLGDLSSPAAVERFVQLVAELQRDYVSIHPFPDGNGRTSRLLIYHLVARANLPVPRLTNPNEDLYSTAEEWTGKIREAMLATSFLERDLSRRIRGGLSIEGSVELATPVLPFHSQYQPSITKDYSDHLKSRFKNEPNLKGQFEADPVGVMRKIRSEYQP